MPSPPALLPDGLYEEVAFSDLTLDDADASGARFLDCAWTGGVLTGLDLERAVLRGGSWEGVRLLQVHAARVQVTDVRVSRCAVAGGELFGSQWKGVRLEGVVLDSVNLRQAHWQDVELADCVLRDVDLAGARLERVTMPGTRTERLDLTKATLHEVDLRGARIDVQRGLDRLRGAVVDPGQLAELAPALARHLGITVRDPSDR